MIEFTCPGCLARCVANEAFADMRARCVVCGAFIRIPAETGEVAFPLGPIPKGPLPSRPARRAAPTQPPKPSVRPGSGSGFGGPRRPGRAYGRREAPQPDADPGSEAAGPAVEVRKKPPAKAAKAPAAKAKSRRALADLEDAADELEVSDTRNVRSRRKKEENPAAKKPPRKSEAEVGPPSRSRPPSGSWNRMFAVVGGSVVASVAIVCVLVFVRGEEKPKLPPPPQYTQTEREPETPPAKKEEPKKEEPKKEEAKKELTVFEGRHGPSRVGGVRSAGHTAAAQVLAPTGRRTRPPTTRTISGSRSTFAVRSRGSSDAVPCPSPRAPTLPGGITRCVFPRITARGPIEPPPEVAACSCRDRRSPSEGGTRASSGSPTAASWRPPPPPTTITARRPSNWSGSSVPPPAATRRGSRFQATVVLEPTTTDCPVAVRCLFQSEASGRSSTSSSRAGRHQVRVAGSRAGRTASCGVHDCQLISEDDPPLPGLIRVPAEQLFAAYEVDLLPVRAPRGPRCPRSRSRPEGLADAFATDPDAANGVYRYKAVRGSPPRG